MKQDFINLAPDKKRARAFVYHPEKAPTIIYSEEVEKYLADGYFDSPAKFVKPEQFGMVEDTPQFEDIKEKIEGINENIAGILNLEQMSRTELIKYGEKHHDVNLKNPKFTNIKRRELLMELSDGKTPEELNIPRVDKVNIKTLRKPKAL